ncbi:cytochrome c biogenesis protein CcsA [Candidatus Albibeggiatoa sp. nov. NOAA]|uniref:cytochrome C assembly family protein n=1 Tax=Candidatus Albibeggiatoa sp. nov. NOAA TaxID=3162724 RepID=UPI003300FA96|nr:cytochrome c biogenesis protein CcsA [Thiotrichaceae bacterium]
MSNHILGLSAILAYLLATTSGLFVPNSTTLRRQAILILSLIAIILHAMVLRQTMVMPEGLNLGIFNAASLVSWVIALLLMLTLTSKPIESLISVLFPLAALSIGLALYFHNDGVAKQIPIGVQIHIFYSILAYSVLTISAIQAIFLAIQDYQLRHKRLGFVMRKLPPLQLMESLLFQMIGLGLLFLTLSLISGFVFLQDIFAQHLVHKTALSIAAWWLFAILLWGRWQYGWRGRMVIRWHLFGFFILMLAYFGSKLVLELILHRT